MCANCVAGMGRSHLVVKHAHREISCINPSLVIANIAHIVSFNHESEPLDVAKRAHLEFPCMNQNLLNAKRAGRGTLLARNKLNVCKYMSVPAPALSWLSTPQGKHRNGFRVMQVSPCPNPPSIRTRTPTPNPQSQSISRSGGSISPTPLTYFALRARGC